MAGNLIRGTQIAPASITADRFVTGLGLATTQLADGASFLKRDGTVIMTSALNFGGFKATNMQAGTAATDGVNLSQLQAIANGTRLIFCRVLSPTNVSTLSGLPTADGVTLSSGDYIFLPFQTTQSTGGPWVVQSGSWTRPPEWAAGGIEQPGVLFIMDPDGSQYKNTKWFLQNTTPVTVDTTAVTFQQDLSGVNYTAGAGLALAGTTFSAARGVGIGLDGSNNLVVTSDPNRLLQSIAAGVGIKDGTAGQIILANSSGNAAYATVSGDVTISATGATTVNHTAGSGFLKYTDRITNEVPSGSVNGTNTTFNLANTPQNASLELYKSGQLMNPGTGNDYTISGAAITMLTAPLAGENLQAHYIK